MTVQLMYHALVIVVFAVVRLERDEPRTEVENCKRSQRVSRTS